MRSEFRALWMISQWIEVHVSNSLRYLAREISIVSYLLVCLLLNGTSALFRSLVPRIVDRNDIYYYTYHNIETAACTIISVIIITVYLLNTHTT